MKHSSRPFRAPSILSDSVHRQLNLYGLAAGAAGVGILALAPPAESKIIYTPAHVKITPNHAVPLDLNHDGKTDFTLDDTLYTTTAGFYRSGRLSIQPHNANEAWGHRTNRGFHYASPLAAGVKVGAQGAFAPGSLSLAYAHKEGSSSSCDGKWNNVQRRYLGLKFTIQGKTHFGWARLNVSCTGYTISALLTGYAYETIPNKPIVTGKTKTTEPDEIGFKDRDATRVAPPREVASLSLLATGAPGLSIWRREEPVAPER